MDDKEKELILQMRGMIPRLAENKHIDGSDFNAIELDDSALLRFLRAREYDVAAAVKQWSAWVSWRRTIDIDTITEDMSFIKAQVDEKKVEWIGHDKSKFPCCIIRIRKHVPGRFTNDELLKFAIFMLEKGTKIGEGLGVQQVCVIWDRTDMQLGNFDSSLFALVQQLITMINDNYAERLGKAYILGANWFFWMIFKVMSPLLSAKTRDKVVFVNDARGLLEHFDRENLSEEYVTV